ncbi:putative bifunctional diguanylate cyclase/phosphodiesterase [Croceicoccus hydrothermalis]|uniref:putative bifunctional diguanylate cyclase/phosphodiesterase n=1 Tax=Croceicoccus hydrothermalis TaxID=2867964 RepID=UPI003B82EF48
MYDGDGRLVVANRRFAEIYEIAIEDCRTGTPIADLLDLSAELRRRPKRSRDDLRREHLRGPWSTATVFEQEWNEGRRIRVSRNPIQGGGFLETVVDRTDSYKAERYILHLARHDPLTDLPNRIFMRERMEDLARDRRGDTRCAVLCLDLDRFKDVNDVLGHGVGDKLLIDVAGRLAKNVRESDLVVRLGGDEFAVIQHSAGSKRDVGILCDRLIAALSEPFHIDDQVIRIGSSIGVRFVSARDLDPDVTLNEADAALYAAKAAGRGTWKAFNAQMGRDLSRRRELEQDLRTAIDRDQFVMHYQPQIDTRTQRIYGFEALVRWNHPHRGLVAPDEFIPVCEETGLINRLGEVLLRKACTDAASWPDDITLAVNVSAVQFRFGNLPQIISAALSSANLAGSRLELEITEGVVVEKPRNVLRQLRAIKKLGVKISLDDFGNGYSSLSYVRNLPFDRVKIDRSFIKDLESQKECLAIVRAVAGMCGGLGIQCTAEGVENEEQLRILNSESFNSVQGFLFSPAVPADEVMTLISSGIGVQVRAA